MIKKKIKKLVQVFLFLISEKLIFGQIFLPGTSPFRPKYQCSVETHNGHHT